MGAGEADDSEHRGLVLGINRQGELGELLAICTMNTRIRLEDGLYIQQLGRPNVRAAEAVKQVQEGANTRKWLFLWGMVVSRRQEAQSCQA